MERQIVKITKCRACYSEKLISLFSLGEQYVSDFVEEDKIHSGIKCPLELVRCETCTLVQLKHTAPQDFLYTRHYWYKSGTTQTMRNALKDVVDKAMSLVKLERGDVVLDIGANDGTLLLNYPDGVIRVAVEPATNLAIEAKRYIDICINDFWSAERYYENEEWSLYVRDNPKNKAKIITACGMLYDLEDPNPFIADIKEVLHPDGIFIAQLQCLKQTIELGDVGNYCHEHLEYYTIRSLNELLGGYGLVIIDIEENNVNGGSYRFYICHKTNTKFQFNGDRVFKFEEKEYGYNLASLYNTHYISMAGNALVCKVFIKRQKEQGKKIWVIGASTKGNVILQFYGLDHTLIDAAVERSEEKIGKFTIGTGIPIKNERDFLEANPDYGLILPYAFSQEIIQRYRQLGLRDIKYLIPLPEFKVV